MKPSSSGAENGVEGRILGSWQREGEAGATALISRGTEG